MVAVCAVILLVYVILVILYPAFIEKTFGSTRNTIIRSVLVGIILNGFKEFPRLIVCHFIAIILINILLNSVIEILF